MIIGLGGYFKNKFDGFEIPKLKIKKFQNIVLIYF
jgi:hypothetical protein